MTKIDSEWKYTTTFIDIDNQQHAITMRYRLVSVSNPAEVRVEIDYEDIDRQTKQIKRLIENQE